MDRRLHRFVAWCMLVGLLLVQASGAALACPLLPTGTGAPAQPAMHEGCSGHQAAAVPAPAPANSALCELHCQTALTVPATPSPPVALIGGEPLLVPVLPAAATADDADAVRSAPLAMSTAPPVSIRFCRFQI
ncbi:MAG: hypothetical protein U1F48_14985 [Burkholderiales bacterium]